MTAYSASGEAGSILVEALVATALVALVLGATFEVTAESLSRHRSLEARREALSLAQSTLAEVGYALPLRASVVAGSNGDDAWQVQMQPCSATKGSSAGVLYCVSVAVSAAGGGPPLVTLSTRRLAPLQQSQLDWNRASFTLLNSKRFERDADGDPRRTCPHPALA